jgi:hypothetical protein
MQIETKTLLQHYLSPKLVSFSFVPNFCDPWVCEMITVHVESRRNLEVHGVTRFLVANSDNPGKIVAE